MDHDELPQRALSRGVLALAATFALSGCQLEIGDMDTVFYDGDGRSVHCAVNLDTNAQNSLASIDSGLDRAVSRREVVELYAHSPDKSVPMATLEHVLAGAAARGLPFVTYSAFARGEGTGPGIALSLDDSGVDRWMNARPLFLQYGAHVTFFVTRYDRMSDLDKANLRTLVGDGHELQAHSVNHLHGPEYVEAHGLGAYLDEEVLPSIDILRADGFDITAYAYPFGARTRETDEAILKHVPILRSVSFSYTGVVQDACP